MNADMLVSRLIDRITQLERIINRQEVRLNNLFREGQIKEVDFAKGVAIVDAHGLDSKEVQWMEPSGDISEWTPPSKGQRVMLVSPGGHAGRSFILPGGFTDSNPAPHNAGAEKCIKIGDAKFTYSGGGLLMEVGATSFSFTAAGFSQDGGQQQHNNINVGSTHKHTEVAPGPALTGEPSPG